MNKKMWVGWSSLVIVIWPLLVVAQVRTPTDQAVSSQPGASTEGVEEIVVTARRVSESLESTPIAITALSAQQLQDRQIQDISDLTSVVPSLHVTGGSAGSAGNAQFFIRGVGQSDFLPTADPAVGVYVDGVYIARTTGNLFDLSDVQQIEVLRGPQGTLFGKNTSGGAISVTTRRPDNDAEGLIEATLGDYWRHDLKASMSGPLIRDQIAASLTVVSRNQDGWGHDLYNGTDLGNTEMQSVRAALNYFGSDTFDYYLTADYTRRHERSFPFALVGVYPSAVNNLYQSAVANRLYPGLSLTDALISPNPSNVYTGGPDANNLNVGGVSGIGTWHVSPNLSVKSITAWRRQTALIDDDYDGSPLPIADYQRLIGESQVSQEIQLNYTAFEQRLNIVGGGFFQHEFATIDNGQPTLVGLYPVLAAINPAQVPFGISSDIDQSDNSYAGYANATFKLTDRLAITAGERYSRETKEFSEDANYIEAPTSIFVSATGTPLPFGTRLFENRTFDSTTPTAGLQYQATPNAFFYFTFAEGFKSGGFDGRPIAQLTSPSGFAPETVKSYEVGGKFELFERKLRANVAAYTMDYNDLQVTALETQSTGLSVNVTRNAGRARIRGIELETVYEPVRDLQLQGNASYTDAALTEVAAGVPFSLNDHLVNTPKWMANLGVQYAVINSDAGKLLPRIDWSYTSTVYNELPNTYGFNTTGTGAVSPGPFELPTAQSPYSLVNARIPYTTGEGSWTVALFSTNLLDKRYKTYGFSALSLGFSLAYYAPPREYGITVSRRFK